MTHSTKDVEDAQKAQDAWEAWDSRDAQKTIEPAARAAETATLSTTPHSQTHATDALTDASTDRSTDISTGPNLDPSVVEVKQSLVLMTQQIQSLEAQQSRLSDDVSGFRRQVAAAAVGDKITNIQLAQIFLKLEALERQQQQLLDRCSLSVVATTRLTQLFRLTGIVNGAGSWVLSSTAETGDTTGVVFSINSATGQIRYTSQNYTGFTSLTFSCNSYIPNVSYLNVVSGINTTSSIVANAGSSFTVAATTFTDSGTAGSGTASTFNASYIAIPTLTASNTNVTTTTASTVYIAGAVIAGTNETITNSYALNVSSGSSLFNGKIVANRVLQGNGTVSLSARTGKLGYQYNTSNGSIGSLAINPDLR
ncbi:hypothetical protein HDU81_008801, partial [Chytriomyces hyalinus]